MSDAADQPKADDVKWSTVPTDTTVDAVVIYHDHGPLFDEMAALLRRLEWTSSLCVEYCLTCGRSKAQGHDAACELVRILSKIE